MAREWRGLQYPRWLCLVAEADDAVVGPVPAARPAGLTSASVADEACGVACLYQGRYSAVKSTYCLKLV